MSPVSLFSHCQQIHPSPAYLSCAQSSCTSDITWGCFISIISDQHVGSCWVSLHNTHTEITNRKGWVHVQVCKSNVIICLKLILTCFTLLDNDQTKYFTCQRNYLILRMVMSIISNYYRYNTILEANIEKNMILWPLQWPWTVMV